MVDFFIMLLVCMTLDVASTMRSCINGGGGSDIFK